MIQTIQDALDWLTTIHIHPHYNLTNIQKLCEIFGHPERGMKCIHITGTNGKGSVAQMTYKILRDAGYKTGLFIGPHLIDVRERFIVNDIWIDDKSLIEIVQKLGKLDFIPTRFEKYVITMLLYFQKMQVDYAVVEVGMGARRDATIVVEPILSVVTSIGLDHKKQFGDSLEGVALEKSAIIRENIPVVVYGKNEILEKVALEKHAPYIIPNQERETNLLGDYQRKNAALAYEVGKIFGISEESIQKSLMHVSHTGRMQYIFPNLLLDGAHNEDGLKNFESYISSIRKNFDEVHYCFTLKKGKHTNLVTDVLGKKLYTLVDIETPQLGNPQEFYRELESSGYQSDIISISSIKQRAQKTPQSLFVVFGSLYMIGEFLKTN